MLSRLKKLFRESRKPSKEKGKAKIKYSLKLSPDCRVGEGKEYSLVLVKGHVRVMDKGKDYAVYDPQLKKWIVFLRRTKDRPLFPFLYELAKKRKQSVHLLVEASCGVSRVLVLPKMDTLPEKFKSFFAPKGEESRLKVEEEMTFINALLTSPSFLITNSSAVRDEIIKKIEELPRPKEVKEELKQKALSNIEVVSDIVDYVLKEVRDSKELYYPKEIELGKKEVALLLSFSLVGAGLYYGYSLYQKKKREELEKMRRQEQRWMPTLKFKETHLYHKVFEPERKDVEKVVEILSSVPPPFAVRSVRITGNEVEAELESPLPVLGGKKEGGAFVVKKTFSRTPKPNWESLRGYKPVKLLPFKNQVKDYVGSVEEVKVVDFDGVKLACAVIDYNKRLTPTDLVKKLREIPKQVVVRELLATKGGDEYTLTFRGLVCGSLKGIDKGGKNEESATFDHGGSSASRSNSSEGEGRG